MVFLSRFYLILATAIMLAVSSVWFGDNLFLSALIMILLAGAALLDYVMIPRDALRANRIVAPVLQQSHPFTVELHLTNLCDYSAWFRLIDSPPSEFTGSRDVLLLRLPAREEVTHSYPMRSYRRGYFQFDQVHYRVQGPIGLVQRQGAIHLPQTVQVLPDLTGEGNPDLRMALAGTLHAGRRPRRSRGEGREFESLRDHRRDDDFRLIDWKASAKRGRLISRQYEIDRDQRLMILIDTGRLMSPKIDAYRKLDYAVNASVHLAQVALQQGDLVGYGIFNDDMQAFVEPKRGQEQLSRLVQMLSTLQPSRLESDYPTVFHQVLKRSSRRTLVVCFTDLSDTFSARRLLHAARQLMPRHLPVVVTVSNSEVLAATKSTPKSEFEVYQHVAASEMWQDYQKTCRSLHSHGIASVSVPAEDLSMATINEYLRIKDSARL